MDIRDFDVVVGARGSKDPRKGLSIALKAIVQSKPKDLKLCLVTVGEKLDRSTIEHLTRAGVVTKQLGWLFDRRRLRDFYQSLDLFVNLSEAETFGLMAQEAASLGCPVMYISGTAVEEVVGGLGISVDGKRVHESALEEFANFLSDPRGVARKISLSKGDSGSRLSRTEFVAAMRSHYFEAAN
jgi:glycosyltransferase involved in cell wall biosynthesis